MTIKALLGLTAAVSLAGWAADYHPLDIKTGQWETTTTTEMNGPPPVPPEVLAKLTPEQRAKIEERTKSLSGRTTIHKGCLTKENLDKPALLGNERQSCTYAVKTSNGSSQEIQVDCSNERMKSSGTVHIEAVNSENVKAAVHMTMTYGDKTSEINSSWTSKWVGPTCTASKGN